MFIPYLVSEREPGGWEDCVWATGVMLANGLAGANVYPPTRAEYEALRVAGGDGPAENPGDGSRLSQLELGLAVRYGITGLTSGNGWAELVARVPVGAYVALNGDTSALPARLRPTTYRGPHTFLVCRDRLISALTLEPLRVSGAPATRATNDELRAYHEALPGAAWLAGWPAPPPEDSMLRWKITDDVSGTAIVTLPGAALVTFDGRRIPIPVGQVRQVVAGGRLLEPLDDAPGNRSDFWLVGLAVGFETENVEAALLLKDAADARLVRIEALP